MTYQHIIDKVQTRLGGWKTTKLSTAGRVTLCNLVLAAFLVYTMQTTKLHQYTCKAIEKLCRDFIWGDANNKQKIHLHSWTDVCQPRKHGGLGIKIIKPTNKAFLMKLAWGIVTERGSL